MMHARDALVLAFVLTGVLGSSACKKKAADDGPAPTPVETNHQRIDPAELQRGQDACDAYATHVCKCAETVAGAKAACELAHALPEALKISGQVSASPDSTHMDVLHAQDTVRKTTAECIEQTAKLPTLGCPP